MALTDKLKAIADAIRGKTGETAEMTLDEMATAIEGISVGAETKMATVTLTNTTQTSTSITITTSLYCKYWDGSAWVSKNFSKSSPLTLEVPVGTILSVVISGNSSASSGFNTPQMSSKVGVDTYTINSVTYNNSSRFYKHYVYGVVVLEETASVNFVFGT